MEQTEQQEYAYDDLTIGVKKTLTRRFAGVLYLNGKEIARDHKRYADKDKAMNRAQLIKDFTWQVALQAQNQTDEKTED